MIYAEMPEDSTNGQPIMVCQECGAGPFSAQRGDYFYHEDSDPVECGECGAAEMALVREVHYYEPISHA